MPTRFPRFKLAFIVGWSVGLGAASAAMAHDTWLLPEHFALTKAKTIVCEMTSGMSFPRLESPIERTRLERAEMRADGRVTPLGEVRSETHALAFLLPLRKPGIATVAVALKPRSLDLTPAQVTEYLEEIGAPAAVREAWAASQGKKWHETYRKLAKSFVRVGNGADGSWSEPMGLPLELVPEADPTELVAGQSLVLRVRRDGKPRPDLAVGAVRSGEKTGTLQTTDAEGRVSVHFAKSGRYLLRATDLRPEGEGGEIWTSDFTTLTLEVR